MSKQPKPCLLCVSKVTPHQLCFSYGGFGYLHQTASKFSTELPPDCFYFLCSFAVKDAYSNMIICPNIRQSFKNYLMTEDQVTNCPP